MTREGFQMSETMLQGFSRLAEQFGDFRQKTPKGRIAIGRLVKGYLALEKNNNEYIEWLEGIVSEKDKLNSSIRQVNGDMVDIFMQAKDELKSWKAKYERKTEAANLMDANHLAQIDRLKKKLEAAENSASNYCTLFWVAVIGMGVVFMLALIFSGRLACFFPD